MMDNENDIKNGLQTLLKGYITNTENDHSFIYIYDVIYKQTRNTKDVSKLLKEYLEYYIIEYISLFLKKNEIYSDKNEIFIKHIQQLKSIFWNDLWNERFLAYFMYPIRISNPNIKNELESVAQNVLQNQLQIIFTKYILRNSLPKDMIEDIMNMII
jgi:hypothetical protein